MDEKVSIILPTYNGEKTIERAIRSVITQSFEDWELLIIDDGSVDYTKTVLIPFIKTERRIIYVKNDTNLGIQKSLNIGLGMAKGEYVARIDDDDEWVDKDKLLRQVKFLNSNQDHILVGSWAFASDKNTKKDMIYKMPESDKQIREKILFKNCFIHSAVLFRKEPVLNLGGYDENEYTKTIEDYHLWLLLGLKGKMMNIPVPMVRIQINSNIISGKHKQDQMRKNILLSKIYKELYPNYKKSLSWRKSMVFLYGFFDAMPNCLKRLITRRYNSF